MKPMTGWTAALMGILMATWLVADTRAQQGDRRLELQEHLATRYRLTVVGQGVLGLRGGKGTIRQAGGVIVLRQSGLYGSLDRDDPASFAIRESQTSKYRGRKDAPVAAGEKFYVHSSFVGSDVVTLGLVSVRTATTPQGPGQLWVGLSFFFPPEVLAQGDIDRVYRVIDAWVLPEDSFRAPAAPAEPPPPPAAPSDLKPGMGRAEVVAALGPPQREVSFGARSWLSYPGLVVLLEKDKLISADASGRPPAKVAISSDPDGADLYLDGSFVGSTPATLELQAGTYKVSVKLSGYQEWQRELKVLAGSEMNLKARLEK